MQGIVLPPACTGAYAFETEVAVLACALACEAVALLCYWAGPRLGRWRWTRAALGRAAVTGVVVLYPTVATSAIGLLHCETVTLTAAAVLTLDGGSGLAGSGSGGGTVTLPVLAKDPFFVCWAGSHTPAGALAVVAVALYVVAFPAVALGWLLADAQLRQKLGWEDVRGRRPRVRCSPHVCWNGLCGAAVVCRCPHIVWTLRSARVAQPGGLQKREPSAPPHAVVVPVPGSPRRGEPGKQRRMSSSWRSMFDNPLRRQQLQQQLQQREHLPPSPDSSGGAAVAAAGSSLVLPLPPGTPRSVRTNPIASALAGYVSHPAAVLAAQQRSSTAGAAERPPAGSNRPSPGALSMHPPASPTAAQAAGRAGKPRSPLRVSVSGRSLLLPVPSTSGAAPPPEGPSHHPAGLSDAVGEEGEGAAGGAAAEGALLLAGPSDTDDTPLAPPLVDEMLGPFLAGARAPQRKGVHRPPSLLRLLFHPLCADFNANAWHFKHLDLCVLLALAALEATLPRPLTMAQVWLFGGLPHAPR